MKDKKHKDAEGRKKHREQLKAKRKKATSLERQEPSLNEKPTILIVCEGENTEPSYFKQFRVSSATIKTVGEGYNTKSLVQRAIEINNGGKFERVWCVFDKDDFDSNDFNSAVQMAEKEGFGVAYSNQAFEYWIILHFDDHQGGGMHRNDYKDKINTLIKHYDLNYNDDDRKLITPEIFELLDGYDEHTTEKRQDLAIKRAERNYNSLKHLSPAKQESSTKIYELVKELMMYV